MREPTVLNWQGGEHPFLLRIGEMLALEKSCGVGIGLVCGRLITSRTGELIWTVNDVIETIRLGLIGGGMERGAASDLTNRAAERVGLMALAPVALEVLLTSLSADDQDDDEDRPADKKKATPPEG